MWRIVLALVVFGSILSWCGGQDIYTASRNAHPQSMSCEEYSQRRPIVEWLRLTECVMSFESMAIEHNRHDSVARLYIPLRSPHMVADHRRTPIALVTEDPALLELVRRESSHDRGATEQLDREYGRPRDYHGLIQSGHRLDSHARAQLATVASSALTENFVLLDDGREPSFFWGVLKLIGGLALIGGAIVVTILARGRPRPEG